jgi:hypothetical protein
MPYFPESIMPSRLKDESQDVKGNKFIVSALDVNKHDEEIRAIERVIGVRRPRFPTSGFRGGPGPNPEDPFEGDCLPGDMIDGKCPGDSPDSPDESGPETGTDVYVYLDNIFKSLSDYRDNYLLMTSGIVGSEDPEKPAANGKITFPTDWPITTLLSEIPDASVDEEEALADLESIELSDVSTLPDEGGFITIINDAVPIMYVSENKNLRAVGYTSIAVPLADPSSPIYAQNDMSIEESAALRPKIFGLGTNVEILQYSELDRDTNCLLNVKRKQLGTTSTRHSPHDLVFSGRFSICFGPINYRFRQTEERKRIDAIDCVLRSNGKIELNLRKMDLGNPDLDDNRTTIAYVHYHAVLLREIEPIPII